MVQHDGKSLPVHFGLPTVVRENEADEKVSKSSAAQGFLQRINVKGMTQRIHRWRYPWLGWGFVYAFVLFVFFVYRCTALKALIMMYGTARDGTPGVMIGALCLGFIEDVVCATYFACALWLFDSLKLFIKNQIPHRNTKSAILVDKFTTFVVSWVLFIAMLVPFVADAVIARVRQMRFTFDIVKMAIHEKDNASSFEVSNSEITDACLNIIGLVAAATFFAFVRVWAPWADLSPWNPTQLELPFVNRCLQSSRPAAQVAHSKVARTSSSVEDSEQDDSSPTEDTELNHVIPGPEDATSEKAVEFVGLERKKSHSTRYIRVEISEDTQGYETKTTKGIDKNSVPDSNVLSGTTWIFKRFLIIIIGLVIYPVVVVAISCAALPLISYSALNTTLNELFKHALEPTVGGGSFARWNETYVDKSEEATFFGPNTLYRRTTGFHGDLAFDVNVTESDPPNVLLIVVESFRYHDSHYLVGEEDPSNLFSGSNITITPNFDKWAKRGIALRNYWSSWRTSRSVESLLFGQLPYDSVTNSGMSGGRTGTELSGLPQLFTAKGYETFFTTGCLTDYDSWDVFLPSHGFDTVWSRNEMKKLAQSDLGITSDQWDGPEHRALNWGVHDDVSFQLLGDLMVNKTRDQRQRVAEGEAKKPLFLNHYTISSHVDYKQRPKWYDESQKPDFSALYEGKDYADNIKNYLEIRYFTDMQLGKFLDRMAAEGILNDTIVVISGDHGQSPEFGNDVPENRDVSTTRVAGTIIAEGRLGDAVGMVIDDATEQYDILNTLADITGVPEGGFEQDGVGRSLKRKIEFGERVVYSNNPSRKMSIVRGHERLRYDKVSDSMLLHNADSDHDMKTDLLPQLSAEERAQWMKLRNDGRRLNSYYTNRWDGSCLLAANC